jgi:DNA repair exonuclease SbcCD ATPase subunit
MRRLLFLGLGFPLLCPTAYTQTTSTDSQTLQTLLGEVRQLRQDLRTSTVAIERAQILIHRLQVQEAAVGRALQRLDEARSRIAVATASRQGLAAQIKNIEDRQGSFNNALEQKETADLVAQLKAKLGFALSEEQEKQAKVTECEEQVRLELAKRNEFQDQLDQLDRVLKNSGTCCSGGVATASSDH